MALIAPMVVYGWGCWLLGRTPIGKRMPWDLLLLLGVVVLTPLRRQIYIGTNGWWMVALGAAAAFLMWLFMLDEKRGFWRKSFGSLLIVHTVLRLRQFSHNDPKMMGDRGWGDLFGFGFSASADWAWLLAGVIALYAWWKMRPLSLDVVWVPVRRLHAALLAVPLLSLGYLHFELQAGPVEVSPNTLVSAPADAPNVVLISWDTVRADTLPLFGGGGLETPNLDSLAASGVLFDNYHTVAPITAPAHNSMLTGMLPPGHGLRANGDVVSPLETPRLPEIFRASGWDTGAFISVQPVIGRDKGFSLGFDHFDDRQERTAWSPFIHALGYLKRTVAVGDRLLPEGLDFASATTPGATTTARASSWIAARDRPFFAWVHLFDAHDPRDLDGDYAPFAEAATATSEAGPHARNPECEISLVEQRGEIAFMDFQLGILLDALRAKDPQLDNTVIALVADHGECFGEGADVPELFGDGGIKVLHVPSLYEATQHVIGLVKPPVSAGVISGLRVGTDAAHIDLLPTICELAGVPTPEGLQGRSLMPAMRGDSMLPRPLYMEAFGATNGNGRLLGWLDGDWKYVTTIDNRFEFLFHAESGDAKNLAGENPEQLALMRSRLDQFRATMKVVERGEGQTSAAERAVLDALGYTDSDDE